MLGSVQIQPVEKLSAIAQDPSANKQKGEDCAVSTAIYLAQPAGKAIVFAQPAGMANIFAHF